MPPLNDHPGLGMSQYPALAKLIATVRERANKGRCPCRILSLGDECPCDLCLADAARAELARAEGLGTHLSHCNHGEQVNDCKYGELDCPALSEEWRWFGETYERLRAPAPAPQGSAEAMREAAAKQIDAFAVYSGPVSFQGDEWIRRVKHIAAAIRALPLPPATAPEPGSEEIVQAALALDAAFYRMGTLKPDVGIAKQLKDVANEQAAAIKRLHDTLARLASDARGTGA